MPDQWSSRRPLVPCTYKQRRALYDHQNEEKTKRDAPRIRAKLVQRFDPIDDKILELPLTLAAFATLVAIHDDDVLHAGVSLGRSTLFYHSRLLEDGLFEELAHVPESDERCRRGGDDDDWDFVPYAVRTRQLEYTPLAMGGGHTGSFTRCFRFYHSVLVIAQRHNSSF